jgi:hypothetical protein
MKVCTKCKVGKEYSEFTKSKANKDGFQAYCKECSSLYHKKHKDKRKPYCKQYRIKNRAKIVDYHTERREKEGRGVYCFFDTITKEPVYVGSGWISGRVEGHYYVDGSSPRFHALIKENGYDRYEYRILEIIESPQSLRVREQFYIDLYKPICNIKKAKA